MNPKDIDKLINEMLTDMKEHKAVMIENNARITKLEIAFARHKKELGTMNKIKISKEELRQRILARVEKDLTEQGLPAARKERILKLSKKYLEFDEEGMPYLKVD